jgi:hypothetical protein
LEISAWNRSTQSKTTSAEKIGQKDEILPEMDGPQRSEYQKED